MNMRLRESLLWAAAMILFGIMWVVGQQVQIAAHSLHLSWADTWRVLLSQKNLYFRPLTLWMAAPFGLLALAMLTTSPFWPRWMMRGMATLNTGAVTLAWAGWAPHSLRQVYENSASFMPDEAAVTSIMIMAGIMFCWALFSFATLHRIFVQRTAWVPQARPFAETSSSR
jgi:hypothetical protein